MPEATLTLQRQISANAMENSFMKIKISNG
jgi:hypothetical protein